MSANAGTIELVKGIQRSGGKEAWYQYVLQTQQPAKRDPAAHSEGELQQFIDGYNSGQIVAVESASSSLVEQVKFIQREGGKEAWYGFIRSTSNPQKKDPAAHSDADLQQFLDNYNSGGAAMMSMMNNNMMSEGSSASSTLVDQVKTIQRDGGKEAWYSFVRTTNDPMKKDPAAHSDEELQNFIDGYNSGSLGMMSMMNNMFEDSSGSKSNLVQQIKNFQKESQAQKECWYEFVTTTNDPTSKDPSRHSEQTLKRFVKVHINGEVDNSGGKGGWGDDSWGGEWEMMKMMMQMMMGTKGKGKGRSRPF